MIESIKHFYNNLMGSLDTEPHGFSARKLTAFMINVCVIAIHIKYIALGDFRQLEAVLMIDYGFVASLFGMTTYQNVKREKKENQNGQ